MKKNLFKTSPTVTALQHFWPCLRFAAWLMLLMTGALAALAQGPHASHTHDALGARYAALKDLAPSQTRMVFYRPVGDGLGVITLHVDGRYHTSLQNGAYSSLCLDRASVNLQAQPGRSWARADAAREVSQNVVMSGGQTLFVRLSEAQSTRPRMDVVSERVAESEVQATREQIHSLSRVAQARPCQSAAMPYLTFAPHVITLSAQSVRNTSELAQLVQRLELQYSAFKSVSLHIVGFAHDTGSEASNHSASKQLASEVQRFIQAQTGSFRPVTAEGRGSKEQSNVRGQPASYVEIGITVESH